MRTTKALALRTTTGKWRDEMHLTLAALLTSGSAFGVATPASAVAYLVCLAGGEAATLQCDYRSLQQCRAAASGMGYRATNPAYASNAYAYGSVHKRVLIQQQISRPRARCGLAARRRNGRPFASYGTATPHEL